MTTVLQKLSLNAYRGVSGLVLENLTPVSLVVGANNSGKSSILEAAGLLLRPPDPTQWVNAVRQRDSDRSLVDGLWSVFPGSEALKLEGGIQESNALVVTGLTSGAPRRLEARCVVSQAVGTWGDGSSWGDPGAWSGPEPSVRLHISVDEDPPLTLKLPGGAVAHQVPMYRGFTVTPATHYSSKALVEHLSRVVEEGKKTLAVELLRMFDPNVTDLDVVAPLGREAVLVTHRTRGVVDLASFGDGMRRSAILALALTRASQGVLLVDEIETGIHHTVLRPVLGKLLDAAATMQVQLVATTHSLEAVDAILGAIEDRGTPEVLSAFWVQRKDGKHEVRRYDFAKLCRLREGGLDIR